VEFFFFIFNTGDLEHEICLLSQSDLGAQLPLRRNNVEEDLMSAKKTALAIALLVPSLS
jgi:hypothetical protein